MDVIVPCKLCHLKQQKGPKVAIYSKKSYFSEKIIPFSYLLLAKGMKFLLKLKNHTRVASVDSRRRESPQLWSPLETTTGTSRKRR